MRTAVPTLRIAAIALLIVAVFPAQADNFQARIELTQVGKHAADVPEAGVEKMLHGAMTGTVSSATHVDLSGAIDVKTWTVVVPAGGGPRLVGTDNVTANDGSILHVRYEGIPSFATEDGVGHGRWSVLGGSGRYAGASGGGEFTYRATEGGGVKVLEGNLDY